MRSRVAGQDEDGHVGQEEAEEEEEEAREGAETEDACDGAC